VLIGLLLNSISYLVDTLKWLWETQGNGKIMLSTLHYYLNLEIKPSDKYAFEEVWSIAEQFEADDLVMLLYS
jgi:hypothetical protein